MLQQFSRKLRLLEFFYKENESQEERSPDGSIKKKPNQRSSLIETEIEYWIKTLTLLIV